MTSATVCSLAMAALGVLAIISVYRSDYAIALRASQDANASPGLFEHCPLPASNGASNHELLLDERQWLRCFAAEADHQRRDEALARLDATTDVRILGDNFFLGGGALSVAAATAAALGLLLPRVRAKTFCLSVSWLFLLLAVITIVVLGPLSYAWT